MLPRVTDYFDAVGSFLSAAWAFISDGFAHIALLPTVVHDAAAWCSVGVSALPEPMIAVLPTAIGGILLFRVLRM